jgi:hypothetical protein
MMTRIFIAAALLVMPHALVAAPKEPLRLKPSMPWNVDFAEDRCRIARVFGADKEQVFMFLDRYGPGEYFRLTVAGKPIQTVRDKGDASVQFGPVEKEQQLDFLAGTLNKLPALIFVGGARVAPPSDEELAAIAQRGPDDEWIELAPVSDARLRTISNLTIGKPLQRAIVLETGPMRGAFKVSDACIDDLMTTWGIDVEKHKTMLRMPTPQNPPSRWIVSSDYPIKMLRIGQPAIVEFRLSIGADGVPLACHIQETTRPKEFDNAVCKSLMRRARFEPALDATGTAITSYYRNTVRFQIP